MGGGYRTFMSSSIMPGRMQRRGKVLVGGLWKAGQLLL